MAKSVVEAIQEGDWSYEPTNVETSDFIATDAVPGSPEKLAILAQRIQQGYPLWHPDDRHAEDVPLFAGLRALQHATVEFTMSDDTPAHSF